MSAILGFNAAPLLRHLELTVQAVNPSLKYWTSHDTQTRPTAQEMADVAGVTRRTITRWQAGQRVQRWDADDIATRLGLHVTALFPDFHETIDSTGLAQRERARLEREEAEGYFGLAPRRKQRVSKRRTE